MNTLKDMLLSSVEQYGDQVALRYKQGGVWLTRTYKEFLGRVRQVTEVLGNHQVKAGDRVALFRSNSEEWPEIYFAIIGVGAIAVPIDAKLLEQEVAHILQDSGARLLFSEASIYKSFKETAQALDPLEAVYLKGMDSLGEIDSPRVAYKDYDSALYEVEPQAASPDNFFDQQSPTAEDIASFIYTSGTTGRPKGAMLSHANFLANVKDGTNFAEIRSSDNFLLVLPLHHALPFMGSLLLPLYNGSEISVVESLRTVGENVREVSPTIIVGVPLLFEKMYSRIMSKLRANKVGHTMFRLGIRGPIIRKIQENLGGRLRLAITGGAPADADVIRGFAQLGVLLIEGYGLTETAPVLTMTPPSAPKPGTVGVPLASVEIRIFDPNPEGIGEIAARGPNIMKGYFNRPEATAEAFREGWFLTGDLGFVDGDGYLKITGRKKSLIVNREGKNIYPEEVESAINGSAYILESLVLGYQGSGGKVGERVGVIVVPDMEALRTLAKRTGKRLDEKEQTDLIKEEIKERVSGLSDYKRPRRIQIRQEAFEKTSTQKVKRYLYTLNVEQLEH